MVRSFHAIPRGAPVRLCRVLHLVLEQCFCTEAEPGEQRDRRLLGRDDLHHDLGQRCLDHDQQCVSGEPLSDPLPTDVRIDHEPEFADVPRPADTGDHGDITDDVGGAPCDGTQRTAHHRATPAPIRSR